MIFMVEPLKKTVDTDNKEVYLLPKPKYFSTRNVVNQDDIIESFKFQVDMTFGKGYFSNKSGRTAQEMFQD